ncbi:MAG: hypothetical protein ACERKV_01165 [Clostridiaceae bacterium]
MSVDEIIMYIEKLNNEEREKFLMLIQEKYGLTTKIPSNAAICDSSYDFWINKDDDIYDELT